MIGSSRTIAIILVIQMIALLAYNFAGMCVTGQILFILLPDLGVLCFL